MADLYNQLLQLSPSQRGRADVPVQEARLPTMLPNRGLASNSAEDQEGYERNAHSNEMPFEQDGNMGQEDNRNEEIPNELPDNRKTKGGYFQ